tara:strand:- start:1562 stop:2566 length:1005 start_codon:yes stop_codon:yes gene_type:complete
MNRWYDFKNEASRGIVDVYIFDEIGNFGVSAQSFIEEIKSHKGSPMNIHVNCVGGDVFEGMAIYNVIKKRSAKTTVYIEGIAASMGSVIALAADRVIMAENSLFMIHNAWGGATGEARDMMKTAKLLEKISGEIADIYTKKTGMPYDKVKDMMDEETWLSAEEAYDLGFVDSISDAIKVAAKYDVSKFKNITSEEISSKLSINQNSKKMTDELKNWFNAKVEDIIKSVKAEKSEAEAEEVVVNVADNDEIVAKLTDFEVKVTELNGLIADLEGEKLTLTEEVERLNALANKAEAKGTEVKTEGDPNVREDKVVDANAHSFATLADRIKSKYNSN